MTHEELKYRIAFSGLALHSIDEARRLVELTGSERELMEMPQQRLAALLGTRIRALDDDRRRMLVEKAEEHARWVEAHGVSARYFTDDDYPQRLLECVDAPLMLYALGSANLNPSKVIGIVGTRNATMYGLDFVSDLVSAIAERAEEKPLIVSGLAHGIDGAAHRASLKQGLPTAGVLAHGLNMIYPAVHREMASKMARGEGALITEYPAHTQVHRGNFLARNRIIAGMSDCLIVVESDQRGGALVTARIAADYNRDVFALPGRLTDRYSRGCNRLIHNAGAQAINDIDTLLDDMNVALKPSEGEQQQLPLDLKPQEQQIVDLLTQRGRITLAELAIATGRQSHKLLADCINLEYQGVVQSLPGGQYRLR